MQRLLEPRKQRQEMKQILLQRAWLIGLLVLALSGVLCGCDSYVLGKAEQLVPELENFQLVETEESCTEDETQTSSAESAAQLDVDEESSVADEEQDGTAESAAQSDMDAVLSMIEAETDVTEIVMNTDGTEISGEMYCTIEQAEVFDNLYMSGFSEDQIGYFGEHAFPYRGSVDFDEQVFDRDSGALSSNVGLLRVKLTVTNENAVNHASERNYDDGALFDIRQFYLADFSLLDRFEEEDGMQCSYPMLFSGYQERPEGAFIYRLVPGESQSFYLGYLVDFSTFSIDTAFLSSASYFVIPDGLSDVAFYVLPEETGEK